MSAGTTDMLVDNSRYIDTPDLTLNAGESYVIAFYSSTIGKDWVSSGFGVVFNSTVTWIASRHAFGSGLPAIVQTTQHKIGPNFLFVPEPSGICLAMLSLSFIGLARRRPAA